MTKIFKFFAENEEVFCGNFGEVPQHYRDNLIEALVEWGDCLSKGGLNELIYSSFHWYNSKRLYCESCNQTYDDIDCCEKCGVELIEQFIHSRDEKIERLLSCIGMINRFEIENL